VTINITAGVMSPAGSFEVSMGTPSNGVVAVVTANQAWTYTPTADWFGTDVFQYNVTAGGVTVTALVNITVVSVPGEQPDESLSRVHIIWFAVDLAHWSESILITY
jgi:hypothetical protein